MQILIDILILLGLVFGGVLLRALGGMFTKHNPASFFSQMRKDNKRKQK